MVREPGHPRRTADGRERETGTLDATFRRGWIEEIEFFPLTVDQLLAFTSCLGARLTLARAIVVIRAVSLTGLRQPEHLDRLFEFCGRAPVETLSWSCDRFDYAALDRLLASDVMNRLQASRTPGCQITDDGARGVGPVRGPRVPHGAGAGSQPDLADRPRRRRWRGGRSARTSGSVRSSRISTSTTSAMNRRTITTHDMNDYDALLAVASAQPGGRPPAARLRRLDGGIRSAGAYRPSALHPARIERCRCRRATGSVGANGGRRTCSATTVPDGTRRCRSGRPGTTPLPLPPRVHRRTDYNPPRLFRDAHELVGGTDRHGASANPQAPSTAPGSEHYAEGLAVVRAMRLSRSVQDWRLARDRRSGRPVVPINRRSSANHERSLPTSPARRTA